MTTTLSSLEVRVTCSLIEVRLGSRVEVEQWMGMSWQSRCVLS
jgi:hypothetical protein